MNRTFLIILMIGTAMMIAVIGQHEPANRLETMPWEVDQLDNGSLRVFGLTLGKTSIQEANQIFASFGKTQFGIDTADNGLQTYQLITVYDDLSFGGLIAKLKLGYQIEPEKLLSIYKSLNSPPTKPGVEFYPVDKTIELEYLNSAISSITYIPSLDYDLDTIRQNFGQASSENTINDEIQLWNYPQLGLTIHIHSTKSDEFVYAPLQ